MLVRFWVRLMLAITAGVIMVIGSAMIGGRSIPLGEQFTYTAPFPPLDQFSREGAVYTADAVRGVAAPVIHENVNVAWSPDGQRMAYLTYDDPFANINPSSTRPPFIDAANALGTLWVVEADTLTTKAVAEDRRIRRVELPSVVWSPDGQKIGFRTYGDDGLPQTGIADLTTGQTTYIAMSGSRISRTMWLPDSSGFLYLALDSDRYGDLRVQPLNQRCNDKGDCPNTSVIFTPFNLQVNSLVYWSPDGQQLIFSGTLDGLQSDVFLTRWRCLTGPGCLNGFTNLTTSTYGDEDGPVWSPDGMKIAYIADNIHVDLYDAQTGQITRLGTMRDPSTVRIMRLNWSSSGGYLVVTTVETTYTGAGDFHVYLLDAATGVFTRMTGIGGSYFFPTWRPTGLE